MVKRKICGEDVEYVKEWYKKVKAQDIADELGLTLHQVYEIARKYKLQQKQNMIVDISGISEQIILSGIIGDGSIKRNGRYNYYYSECHAFDELEYLKWKFDNLGDLTKLANKYGKGLYGKNFGNQSSNAMEFTTLTTPSLKRFYEMKKIDVINNLNELGLWLLIFDDGWANKKKGIGYNVYISSGVLNIEELNAVIFKIKEVFGLESRLIGKRKDISITMNDEKWIENSLKKYGLHNLDVAIKKFGYY